MVQDGIVLEWQGGGEAAIVGTDGVYGTLRSTRQAAPGTPLWAKVCMKSGAELRFKVKHCRRLDPHTFELQGRWVDLPKKMREELLAAAP